MTDAKIPGLHHVDTDRVSFCVTALFPIISIYFGNLAGQILQERTARGIGGNRAQLHQVLRGNLSVLSGQTAGFTGQADPVHQREVLHRQSRHSG